MKNAIILHGMPSKNEYFDPKGQSPSNRHWLPWLQNQLLMKGVLAQTPEIQDPFEPVYEKWKATFERFEIGGETMLIGHSCGGGFLVRWLSENKQKVGRVALVAPWLDLEGETKGGMFDFKIDPDLVSRTTGVTVWYSTDDEKSILSSVALLQKELPGAVFREFTNKGHFVQDDMDTDAFPELFDSLVN